MRLEDEYGRRIGKDEGVGQGGRWPGFNYQQARISSLRHRVQTCSGAQPASYPKCTGETAGLRWPAREADNSPPSSAKVFTWSYTFTTSYVFIAQDFHIQIIH